MKIEEGDQKVIRASKFSGARSENETFASFIVIQGKRGEETHQERVVIWCLTNKCLHYMYSIIQYNNNRPTVSLQMDPCLHRFSKI